MAEKEKTFSLKKLTETTTGFITAAAGLMVAITGGIAALIKFLPLLISPETLEIQVKYFEVMPYYFKNFINDHDFLYWYHVKVHNKGKETQHIKIEFEVNDLEGNISVVAEPRDIGKFSIEPDSILSASIDPGFTFLREINDNEVVRLKVIWRILDQKTDGILKTGTYEVTVLPKNIFDWDIKTPDNKPLDEKFLLASLTTWTLTNHSKLNKISSEIREKVDKGADKISFASQWLSQSYNHLFKDSLNILEISPTEEIFPLSGRLKIDWPIKILGRREILPFQAALLLSALNYKHLEARGIRLALFALSDSKNNPDKKSLLISWSAKSDDWRAIDINKANEWDFAINDSVSTSKLLKLLKSSQEIFTALDMDGVFIEGKELPIALDFAKAKEKFAIKAMY